MPLYGVTAALHDIRSQRGFDILR